jgi:hypothetical protein
MRSETDADALGGACAPAAHKSERGDHYSYTSLRFAIVITNTVTSRSLIV